MKGKRKMKIKLIKFNENLITPSKSHYNDAGIDCYALEEFLLLPNIPTLIPLGFGLRIPDGYMAVLKPRSSMNVKGVLTQIGTIDSGYRGEIKAVLINLNQDKDIEIKRGDKICQIVIEPVIMAEFVETLGEERLNDGFGSTGK